MAFLTGPLVGGLIPAIIALVLAREAHRDILAAQGFLLGGRRLRIGVRLAWVGIALALTVLLVAGVSGLLVLARSSGGHDYAPTVN